MLFVEGERTEVDYFTYWRRRCREHAIVVIDDRARSPEQLVDRAVKEKRSQARDARKARGRADDEIWCVFDRDEHVHFDAAVRRATDNRINVAGSNPCIELWFMLHYEDRMAYIERRHAQACARKWLRCSKALTQDALDSMASRYDEAVKRAKALDRKHRDDGSASRSNPSSDVWRLVNSILGEGGRGPGQ